MVRVKHRYLVVNLLYPQPVQSKASSKPSLPDLIHFHAPIPDAFHIGQLTRLIRDQIAELYGDYGSGMVIAGLKVNYFSAATSTFIIRCPRAHYPLVWSALSYITHLPKPLGTPVVFRVVRVSGTIKKAETEVIRRAECLVRRARAWEKDGGESEAGSMREGEKTGEREILGAVQRSVERRGREEVLARVDESEGDSE